MEIIMPDIKNNGGERSGADLKLQDSQKASSSSGLSDKTRLLKPSSADALRSVKRVKKSKVPFAVDVIVAILLLAIIVAAVFGAVYLFRYYTEDYDSVDVNYVFAVPYAVPAEGDTYADLKNEYLFLDVDGNTVGLGRIRSAEYSEDNGMLLLTVDVNAKYNSHEGYSVGDVLIAVGKSYSLRTEKVLLDGTVVELYDKKDNE